MCSNDYSENWTRPLAHFAFTEGRVVDQSFVKPPSSLPPPPPLMPCQVMGKPGNVTECLLLRTTLTPVSQGAKKVEIITVDDPEGDTKQRSQQTQAAHTTEQKKHALKQIHIAPTNNIEAH